MKTPLRYIIAAVGIILVFLLVRNIFYLSASTDRIRRAAEKVEQLKQENERLKKQKERVESQEFLEREAREKLGLAREEETVVILPDEEFLRSLAPEIEEDGLPAELPNWKLWLRLFF